MASPDVVALDATMVMTKNTAMVTMMVVATVMARCLRFFNAISMYK